MCTPDLDKLSAEDRMFHQKLVRRLAMFYGVFALALVLWVVVGSSLRPVEQAKVPANDLTATAVNRFDR